MYLNSAFFLDRLWPSTAAFIGIRELEEASIWELVEKSGMASTLLHMC